MDELEASVDTKRRWAGKGKTRAFRSSLQKAWYLSLDGRRALSAYLAAQGWISHVANFEADIDLARMCQPADILVTKDSDLAAYLSIKKIGQPSRRGFFLYDVDKMCSVVGFPSRAHLQALAVVSRNDYGRNIYGLGFATNSTILKTLPASITGMNFFFGFCYYFVKAQKRRLLFEYTNLHIYRCGDNCRPIPLE